LEENYPKKIRKMILVRVFLLPLIFLILLCGTLVYYFTYSASAQVEKHLSRIAMDHRKLIDCFLSEKTSALKFIVSTNSYDTMSKHSFLNNIFTKLQVESKACVDLGKEYLMSMGGTLPMQAHMTWQGKNTTQQNGLKL